MLPSPPLRCCAVALLCVALALGAACAHAESITVKGNLSAHGQSFDGGEIIFDYSSSPPAVSTLELANSKVSGGGLTIRVGSPSHALFPMVRMLMASTTVTESSITLAGTLQGNSDYRLVATTGTLKADQSLFILSDLVLENNVTLTLEDTTATWPAGSANTGSVVTYASSSTKAEIGGLSGLFILNATAKNGASVLSAAMGTTRSLSLSTGAVLGVDHSRCEKCSRAMVDITSALSADTSSMFRISHATVAGAGNGLLSCAGAVSVETKSLFLVSEAVVESGGLFQFAANGFAASDASTISFLGLTAPSTGLAANANLPTKDDSSTVIGGSCTIASTSLTNAADYVAKGLQVSKVVNSAGAADNTCANAKCVPGHTTAGAELGSAAVCTCTCLAAIYSAPSCTAVVDPTATSGTASCAIANCATCDRRDPAKRCTSCAANYSLYSDFLCVETSTSRFSASFSGSTLAIILCACIGGGAALIALGVFLYCRCRGRRGADKEMPAEP